MRITFTLIVFLVCYISHSQLDFSRDVIGSSGKRLSNNNIQINFTLGEVFTSTLSNNEIHTLGFQQSDQTDIVISVPENNEFNVELFPNPVTNIIIFQPNNSFSYTYLVYDTKKAILFKGENENDFFLNTSELSAGKYFFEYQFKL